MLQPVGILPKFGTTRITKQDNGYDVVFVEDGSEEIYYKASENAEAIKGDNYTKQGWLKDVNITDPDPSGLVVEERRKEHVLKYILQLKDTLRWTDFLDRDGRNPLDTRGNGQGSTPIFSLLQKKHDQILQSRGPANGLYRDKYVKLNLFLRNDK